ncbi:zinc finger protein 850-like [Centruroides sculpturatus]|uniref:zinc finger protein 850-like n=1 Tax=Centruroides sculpturatus TaxID=218467 RepID=UPI000C6E801E|nr:zinc finger protein 850-like [Centruroides sculpturatus]XP_023226581.1 zinc finger protein 850-like [Centruroides sculpturatus]XP_023226588.1 zinc finger protein 850-like [Centruroides sculpturatus]XP_023226595.1 zinc finger protein 850-like [Centruroides sculpturatus]
MDESKDNVKEDDYPDPPVLSPMEVMEYDKMIPSDDKEKQLDKSQPAGLVLDDDSSISKDSTTHQLSNESKKKHSKMNKSTFEYQFQLRQYHIVKGQKLFKCDICSGTYRYAFSLKRHFLRNHINYKYLSKADISNCNINVSLISDNNKRLNNSQQDNSAEGSLIQEPGDALVENSQITFPSLYSCYLCCEYFHNKIDLKNHIENHSVVVKQKEFKCDKCDIKFTLKKNLLRHVAAHNSEKSFICKYCGKQFLTLASQKKHERIHEGKKSYRCIYCTLIFSCNNDLIEHIQNHHKDFYYPCKICSKYFDNEHSLSEHMEQHMDFSLLNNNSQNSQSPLNEINKNFLCDDDALEMNDICNKFDYTCTVCKKKFMSFVNMCRHRRLAHQNSAKKRGRPQKSKINKIDNEDKIAFNNVPERSESEFYMNIAQKISDNLINYIDGNVLQIKQYNNANNLDESSLVNNEVNISWDAYNFPPSFDYHQLEMSEPEPDTINVESDCDNANYNFNSYNDNVTIGINSPNNSVILDDKKYSDMESINGFSTDEEKISNIPLIGQNIPLTYICCACVERFHSVVAIEEHKLNNHPNVFCTHIEIEGEKNVPPEFCKQFCNPVGLLKRYIVPSINAQENNGLTCTKCKMVFTSVSDLHLHILECGGHDNCKQYKSENYGKRKGVRKKRLREVKCQTYSPPKRKCTERSPKGKVIKDDDIEKIDCFIEQEMKENQAARETYSCKDCSKVFNHLSTFERHKRSCRQKLTLDRSSHRKLHMKNTKTAGQHSCPYCKRTFTYKTSLKKHLKNTCAKKIKCKVRSHLSNTKTKLETSEQISVRRIEDLVEHSDYTLENLNFKDGENLNDLSETNNMKILEDDVKIETVNEVDQKSDCVESDLCSIENTKHDIIIENEELLSLKQIQNNENLHNELLLENGTIVKQENNLQRGLFPQQRCCPHCLRSFAYLANFRRHMKEICPVKKQLVKENEENGIKSKCSLPIYNVTTFSVKGKIEDSVIGLLRDQSRQIELMKGTEPEENNPTPSSRFRTFSCKVCHKIFLSLVKMLQHRLSHKLQSDESEDLPKLDLGLMKKLQENSIKTEVYKEHNNQEILNEFDEFLSKPNAKSDKEADNNIVSEESSEMSNIENNKNRDFNCEKCEKTFPNNSSRQRHYKLAHKELINKKSLAPLDIKVYKSPKGKAKKSLLKSTTETDKQNYSDKNVSECNKDQLS